MVRPTSLPAFAALLIFAALPNLAARPPHQGLTLHPTRQSADDLELTGLTPEPGYLTRADLLALPQSPALIQRDPDFPNLTLHVTGVPLEILSHALHVPQSDDLIDALCTDLYRSHYPADYIARHHPILVLQVEGLSAGAWATRTRQEDPGPYFITHAHYPPTFKVLSHSDQRQVPTNVVRLNFTTAANTYGPIAPSAPTFPSVQQGFTIAKQNCLRCHQQGAVGGTKSPRTWQDLATEAHTNPTRFAQYILNPRSLDPKATMPANPTYDAVTRAALTAYFQALQEPAHR